jgi:hypothetical protein
LGTIQEWIEHELKGYHDFDSLPKYRFISGGQLHYHNPYHGWLLASGGSIHRLKLPVFESVPELEKLASGGDQICLTPPERIPLTDFSGSSDLASQFPQRIVFPTLVFIKMIESVRDRLLDWSIELEKQGIRGEDMAFKEEEKEIAKNQIFNIEHMAGVIGDVSHSKVEVYDYSSIHKTLKDAGIPKAERDELEEIMDGLKVVPPHEKPRLIEKGKAWVTKNQEFLGAAASIVLKALAPRE